MVFVGLFYTIMQYTNDKNNNGRSHTRAAVVYQYQ
jgi:hypothetical protein